MKDFSLLSHITSVEGFLIFINGLAFIIIFSNSGLRVFLDDSIRWIMLFMGFEFWKTESVSKQIILFSWTAGFVYTIPFI
jgi:hypothetical protein